MRRALVTGGAGFIGSHLVDRLLADGWAVTTLENFDPFYNRKIKWHNIQPHLAHPNYRLVEADIRNPEQLRSRIQGGFDVIYHLAAKAGVRPSIADPVGYQDVNVNGTQNLLEFAREGAARRFVFASSSSVYGVNPSVPWSEADPLLLPISPYATSKASSELLGRVYSQHYGIGFVVLRLFTVYGPRQRPDLAIHKLARLMIEGERIPVYGDGASSRDYTYVDDIVDGIVRAAEYKGARFDIFNLGSGRPVRLLEMIEAIEDALGVSAKIEHLPPQPGDVPQTFADINKAGRRLGFHPRTDLHEGIRNFVDWRSTESAQLPDRSARVR